MSGFSIIKKEQYKCYLSEARKKEGKHVFWLTEEHDNFRIGCVIFNNVMPNAEVHMGSSDIWYIVEGRAKFILGGEFDNKIEKKPGEFVASSISGGEIKDVAEGDIIDIPPGIPHQVNANGNFLVTIIVKVNL